MDHGGVEHRYVDIALIKQHAHLRAPEDQAIRPGIDQPRGNAAIGCFAFGDDLVPAKLFVNYAMSLGAVFKSGHQRLQSCRHQPVGIECLLHGEGRRHKARPFQATINDRLRRRICNVQQGDTHALHHLIAEFMHCVGRQNEDIGPASLQCLCFSIQDRTCAVPHPFTLQFSNGRKVERPDQQLRRVQATQLFAGEVA